MMSYPFRTVLLLLMSCLHLMFAFCYFQYLSLSPHPPTHSLVCCAKKVGKRCFQYIEILTSHIHKYICYIYSDVCFINQSLLNLSFLIVLKYAAGRRTQDTGSRFYSWLFTALFLGYSLKLFVLWQELIGSFA